ncbi:hypothetical protein [Pasteurella multocida]|uniref:hypothetical protein n=1 Tax=Pasteurella multocida TaxID=747 RepID=UPI0008FA6197|nr:hypothetical protein [Pasteurella multocida]MDC4234626.1 hypothetical protein [Pasteurella multocida]OIQ14658.1 hypothetical protein UR07_03705 [Pasteurella multocida subsp. multocida]PNW23800.1 hypothetical protein AP056_07805 [Pasteurella multocida subsp. multocida]
MNSRVLVHTGLHHIPYIERIAVGIALFHDTGKYPDFLGHFGQFENNPQAMDSLLHKRIDKLLPNLIQKAEEFHKLRRNELQASTAYSADNYQITETIILTD